MNFSKLENLFKLECVGLGNFMLRKDKFENIKSFLSFSKLSFRDFNFI